MLFPACPPLVTKTTRRSVPLAGHVSFSCAPSVEQMRVLLFIMARHAATARKFRKVSIPLKLLFPGLTGTARNEAARTLFGNGSPCLVVRETNAAGKLVRQGSYCMMPLLSCLSYQLGSRQVQVTLNSRLIDYLPQFRELLPQLPLITEVAGPAPLQLAA